MLQEMLRKLQIKMAGGGEEGNRFLKDSVSFFSPASHWDAGGEARRLEPKTGSLLG